MGEFKISDARQQQRDNRKGSEYAYRAFNADLWKIWAGTPWEKELSLLCSARACVSCVRNDDIYARFSRQLLYEYLAGEFDTDDPDAILNMYQGQLPIAFFGKKFLSQAYTQYNVTPRRTFGESGSEMDVALKEIYADGAFDRTLRLAVHAAGVTPAIALRPVWRPRRRVVALDMIYPDTYRVTTDADDPDSVIEMAYPITVLNSRGEKETRMMHWTEEAVFIRAEGNWRRILSEEENRYGRIPFSFLRLRDGVTFYGSGEWDLVEARMEANRSRFLANLNEGSNSSPWILALNLGLPDGKIKTGPNTVWAKDNVGNPADGMEPEPAVEVINPPSEYTMIDQKRMDREKSELRYRGIPASLLGDSPGDLPSGIARLIERKELIELREETYIPLRTNERDLFEVTTHVSTTDSGGKYSFSEDLDNVPFAVDYADEQMIQEPDKEFAYDLDRAERGLISPLSILKKYGELDSEVEEAEAVRFVERNKKLFTKLFQSNGSDQPERSSDLSANVGDDSQPGAGSSEQSRSAEPASPQGEGGSEGMPSADGAKA